MYIYILILLCVCKYVCISAIVIYVYHIICWAVDLIGFRKNLVDQSSFWCPIPPTPQHLVKGMTHNDTTYTPLTGSLKGVLSQDSEMLDIWYTLREISLYNPHKDGKKLSGNLQNAQTAASVDVFACKKPKDNTTAKKTPLISFSPTIRQPPRVLEKTSAFSTPEAIPRRREARENYGELGVGGCFFQTKIDIWQTAILYLKKKLYQ